MIRNFFVSKKINEVADKIENNAEKGSDAVTKCLTKLLEATEGASLAARLVASGYRLLQIVLMIVVTDTPEGKEFRKLIVEFQKAFAKRLRASSGFVTTLTKNKSIMGAIEAFEEDWEAVQEYDLKRAKQGTLDTIESNHEIWEAKAQEAEDKGDITDKELKKLKSKMSEFVMKARTLVAEISTLEDFYGNNELAARKEHFRSCIERFPEIGTVKKDGDSWVVAFKGSESRFEDCSEDE
jgi:hypothetical protein